MLPKVHERLEDSVHELGPEPTPLGWRFKDTLLIHSQGIDPFRPESPLPTFRKRYESSPNPTLKETSIGRETRRRYLSCFTSGYGKGA